MSRSRGRFVLHRIIGRCEAAGHLDAWRERCAIYLALLHPNETEPDHTVTQPD